MDNYETLDLTRYLAGKIRALMGEHGISQAQLAGAVGVSQSQLSKMIRGAKPITIDQFDAMCWAFGIDMSNVLKEAEDFLMNHEHKTPSRIVFVEQGVRLETPQVIDTSDVDNLIPVVGGRKRMDRDVAGASNTVERRQSDYERAAYEEDGETGEDLPDF